MSVRDVQEVERVSNSCTKHERHHCYLRHHSRQTGVVQLLTRSCTVLRQRVDHIQTRGGMYNPPLREFVGCMTDELGGSYITEYVSNGPKNFAYRTCNGIQVVKVNGYEGDGNFRIRGTHYCN